MSDRGTDLSASRRRSPGAAVSFRLNQIGNLLAFLCKQIAGAALIGITVLCTANAGGRYLFNHAISWAEEAMVYLMIVVIFAGSGAVTWHGLHLKLDLMLRKLPRMMQRLVVILTTLGSAALLVILAMQSQRVVSRLWRYNQKSEALAIPMWIPQGVVLAGLYMIAAMMILRLLSRDPLPDLVDYTEEEHVK